MNTAKNLSLNPSLARPRWAWPTLGLFLLVVVGLNIGAYFFFTQGWGLGQAAFFGLVLNLPLLFMSFTPIHEASHRNITPYRKIDDLIGHITALYFMASFDHFKWIHLEHHKHTNDPEKDPDFHVAGSQSWWKRLYWAMTLVHYLKHIRLSLIHI